MTTRHDGRLPASEARRLLLAVLTLLTLGAVATQAAAPAAGEAAATPTTTVDAVGITVSDADRAAAFYRDVLDFRMVADREVSGPAYEKLLGVFAARARFVRMRLGDEHIELIEYLAPRGRSLPPDSRSNDRWFQHVAIIVADMDRAYARLRRHDVAHASPRPQRLPDWNPAAGGIEAFYFRDPDGNPLEVLAFPPDKGERRWQAAASRTGSVFLGIDHTAIVVADTDASLPFYRDTLGLTVAGASENHGPEQERLNAVPGARLRITSLRGHGGIGVELLHYLTPRDGRAMPADTRANDLWHWQMHARSDQLEQRIRHGRLAGGREVSPAVVGTADRALGFARAAMMRDPDGHAVVLGTPGADHE